MRAITRELAEIASAGLLRDLRYLETGQGSRIEIDGRSLLNFSSNDYLGLAGDARICQAASRAAIEFGAGSGASRLISGGLPPHREFETTAARFFGTEAALCFANGYAAALGTLGAFLRKGDVAIVDKLCHACLIDGVRLSGATLRVFPHNRVDKLRQLLAWAFSKVDPYDGRVLVITESIFSMDGDQARLSEIVQATKETGALLMLDEAHAIGLLGEGGRGLAEAEGVARSIDLRMGTMGKAVGAAGGIVAGSEEAIALLWNRARSFIFSTAPPPAQAAAATEGLNLIASSEGDQLRSRLRARIDQFHAALGGAIPRAVTSDHEKGNPPSLLSPILPVFIGDEKLAVGISQELRKEGVLCPALRYPTVARGSARLRITLSAAHEPDQIETLVTCLRRALPQQMMK